MFPTGSVGSSFNCGGQLQLIVNVSSENSARYISSLAWYHNNTCIHPGSKFTITNNNTVLTIRDMEPSDAGVYEVRISAVNLTSFGYSNDEMCDSLFLPSLNLLAAHAPVRFVVHENILPAYQPHPVVTTRYITDNVINDSIELSSIAQPVDEFSLQLRSGWSRNGVQLSDGALYNSTIINNSINSLQLTYSDADTVVGLFIGTMWFRFHPFFFIEECRGYRVYTSGLSSAFPVSVSYWNIQL